MCTVGSQSRVTRNICVRARYIRYRGFRDNTLIQHTARSFLRKINVLTIIMKRMFCLFLVLTAVIINVEAGHYLVWLPMSSKYETQTQTILFFSFCAQECQDRRDGGRGGAGEARPRGHCDQPPQVQVCAPGGAGDCARVRL